MKERKKINNVLQILLGLIFLISAILKTLYIQGFVNNIQSFNILTNYLTQVAAIVIILLEFVVGFLIVFSIWPKYSILTAVVLLIFFSIFSIYAIIAGEDWVCQCFGPLFTNKFSYATILRDTIFLVLSIYVYSHRAKDLLFVKSPKIVLIILNISLFTIYLFVLVSFVSQSKIQKENISIGKKISNIKTPSIDGDIIDISEQDKVFKLLIIFSIKDCSYCLTEFTLWEKIYEEYKSKIQVIGVVYAPNNDYMKLWVKARNLQFPIILDNKKNIMNNYNIDTPVKILLNSDNKIVLFQKSTGNKDKQKIFENGIKKLLFAN